LPLNGKRGAGGEKKKKSEWSVGVAGWKYRVGGGGFFSATGVGFSNFLHTIVK